MAARQWKDFSARTRRLIIVGAIVDGTLKTAALLDLVRRPTGEIRGSKALWASTIIVVNSGGIVPLAYFARGRRP